MPRPNGISKNTSYLLAGNFGLKLITASTAILLIRYLNPDEYGRLSIAFALGTIASFMAKMSLSHTVIREGTKPNADFPLLFGGALRLRVIFAFFATCVFLVIIPFIYTNPALRNIVYIIVIPTIWGGSLLSLGEVYFSIIQRMEFTAIFRAVPALITSIIICIGIALRVPLEGLAYAYGFTALICGISGVFIVRRLVPGMGGWHPGLLNGLWTFALGGVLTLLIGQMGPLILERVTSLDQIGHFSVAFRIPALLYTFPGALAAAFYPRLFQLGNSNPQEHFELSVRETKFMTYLGLMLALPFIIYPEWTVSLLFGSKWVGPASHALAFLSWMVILQCLNYPLADALATQGMQGRRVIVLAVSVILGALLFWNLGKEWGVVGAAVAALLLECSTLIGLTFINPVRWKIIRHCIAPQALIIAISFFGGHLVKRAITSQAIGCVVIPLVFFLLLVLLDKDVRVRLLSLCNRKIISVSFEKI